MTRDPRDVILARVVEQVSRYGCPVCRGKKVLMTTPPGQSQTPCLGCLGTGHASDWIRRVVAGVYP